MEISMMHNGETIRNTNNGLQGIRDIKITEGGITTEKLMDSSMHNG